MFQCRSLRPNALQPLRRALKIAELAALLSVCGWWSACTLWQDICSLLLFLQLLLLLLLLLLRLLLLVLLLLFVDSSQSLCLKLQLSVRLTQSLQLIALQA